MKIPKILFFFASLAVLLLANARADALDDLIAGLRSGAIDSVNPDKRAEILKETGAVAGETYSEGLAALYLWEIRASIVDPESHGGWPYRSFIVMDQSMRKALVKALTKQFDEAPTAVLAFALVCPALYTQDDALVARAESYLKDNAPFFYKIEQEKLEKFWRAWIKNVLEQEAAAKAKEAAK